MDHGLSSPSKDVLWDLYRLFTWFTMKNDALSCKLPGIGYAAQIPDQLGTVLNSRGVSQEQLNALPDKIQQTMTRIRPHAVKLVDAWQIPDFLLDRFVFHE